MDIKKDNRIKNLGKCLSVLMLSFWVCGCAILHHVNIGEIDNRSSFFLKPIEFKVSETGIDLKDVKTISNLMMKSSHAQSSNDAVKALEYFQMGPKTGAPVYNLTAYNDLNQKLRELCPSGKITGIMAIRETRKYPVISGEIVKVKAYCMEPKT